MLVRDLVDLAECDYPWMDGVASEIEFNNLTVPVIMKDTHFHIVDDWGSFEATPSYDAANITALGVYTSDYLSDGYIPVHMDSACELADYLDDLREKMTEATTGMWKMMAGWTREQMIDAGLLVYYGVLKDLAHYAGVYEQDDWFTVDERAQRFKPLFNDEYGNHLIAEIVGLVSHVLAEPERAPHGEVLERPRRDVDAGAVLGARRRRVDLHGRADPARQHLAAGEDRALHHHARQAQPGRVQRGWRRSSGRAPGTCATTTTTPGSRTTRTIRRRRSSTRRPRPGPPCSRAAAPESARRSWRSCAPRRAADPRARASPRA